MKQYKIIRTRQNERTCQRTHIQNHAYVNNNWRTYVRDVRQLSNPALTSQMIKLRQINYICNASQKNNRHVQETGPSPILQS